MESREIKFRVWDLQRENWAYMGGETDYHFWHLIDKGEYDEETLTQYTGLKDKNEQKIYEGDIVAVPYINPVGELDRNTTSHNAEVSFKNGMFVEKTSGKKDNIPLRKWCEKEKGEYIANYGKPTIREAKTVLKVIGNVFEDPDLIKSNSE